MRWKRNCFINNHILLLSDLIPLVYGLLLTDLIIEIQMDLTKLSRADLLKLQADISNEMAMRAEADKDDTRKKLEKMAAEAGFSVEELFSVQKSRKRAPAKVKYRDPQNTANAWSGRGRMPRWLSAEVAKGKKKEDFAV
jgi:DNA-binding protein H-NS